MELSRRRSEIPLQPMRTVHRLRTRRRWLATSLLVVAVSGAHRASSAAESHLLIVVDGLRPDYVTPELMPHTYELAARGVFFADHHAIYPTVTRVNAASIATGSHPTTHGLLGNTIYVPAASPDPLNTGERDNLLRVREATETLLTAETLGEVLHAAGQKLFIGSSGSSGSSFLLNPNVGTGPIVHYDYTVPDELSTLIVERLGPAPEEEIPNLPRHRWTISAYLEFGLDATVAVVWLSDPDKTAHAHGIGSPECRRALTGVDNEVARLLQAIEERGDLERTNILVTSDHGFSTHRGGFDLAAIVEGAARDLGVEGTVVAGGAVYLPPNSRALGLHLVEKLQSLPAVGAIFSHAAQPGSEIGSLPGTLSFDAIAWGHSRAGDLLVAAQWSNEINSYGYAGSSTQNGTAGHGTTSPFDIHNVLIATGPAFRNGQRSSIPSSNADLAPTLCHLAGILCPATATGRILSEALIETQGTPGPTVDRWTIETSVEGYTLRAQFSRVDGRRYFDWARAARIDTSQSP